MVTAIVKLNKFPVNQPLKVQPAYSFVSYDSNDLFGFLPRCGQSFFAWPFLPHEWQTMLALECPPDDPPPPPDIELSLFSFTSLDFLISASRAASAFAALLCAFLSNFARWAPSDLTACIIALVPEISSLLSLSLSSSASSESSLEEEAFAVPF